MQGPWQGSITLVSVTKKEDVLFELLMVDSQMINSSCNMSLLVEIKGVEARLTPDITHSIPTCSSCVNILQFLIECRNQRIWFYLVEYHDPIIRKPRRKLSFLELAERRLSISRSAESAYSNSLAWSILSTRRPCLTHQCPPGYMILCIPGN